MFCTCVFYVFIRYHTTQLLSVIVIVNAFVPVLLKFIFLALLDFFSIHRWISYVIDYCRINECLRRQHYTLRRNGLVQFKIQLIMP